MAALDAICTASVTESDPGVTVRLADAHGTETLCHHLHRSPLYSGANVASAGMPGFRAPSGFSTRILTPKTRFRRSRWVWTLRGVNSARWLVETTTPLNTHPGNGSAVT